MPRKCFPVALGVRLHPLATPVVPTIDFPVYFTYSFTVTDFVLLIGFLTALVFSFHYIDVVC